MSKMGSCFIQLIFVEDWVSQWCWFGITYGALLPAESPHQIDFDLLSCTWSTRPESTRINDPHLSITRHLQVVLLGYQVVYV